MACHNRSINCRTTSRLAQTSYSYSTRMHNIMPAQIISWPSAWGHFLWTSHPVWRLSMQHKWYSEYQGKPAVCAWGSIGPDPLGFCFRASASVIDLQTGQDWQCITRQSELSLNMFRDMHMLQLAAWCNCVLVTAALGCLRCKQFKLACYGLPRLAHNKTVRVCMHWCIHAILQQPAVLYLALLR